MLIYAAMAENQTAQKVQTDGQMDGQTGGFSALYSRYMYIASVILFSNFIKSLGRA